MAEENKEKDLTDRKNLAGFIANNLTPVATSLVAKAKKEGEEISLDAAKIIARSYIIDDWNQAAQSALDKSRKYRGVYAVIGVAWLGATWISHSLQVPLAEIIGAGWSLYNIAAVVGLSTLAHSEKKQIYGPNATIAANDDEDKKIYESAQNAILSKYTSVKMVPTYCPS